MTERNDFYDNLANQLENKDILMDYAPLVDDYLKTWSIEDANVVKQAIISKALSELQTTELQALRDSFTQKALQLSWKQKFRMYELSAWISNWIKEINSPSNSNNINNSPILNEEINESFPNFKIESGSAIINWKDYKLSLHPDNAPVIKKIWDNEYSFNLLYIRDSSSSMRWPENVEIKFSYDWKNIIFFWDKNINDNFDKIEYWRLYKIEDPNYTKIIPQADWTTIIKQFDTTQNIILWKEHLNHYWVDAVKFTIKF